MLGEPNTEGANGGDGADDSGTFVLEITGTGDEGGEGNGEEEEVLVSQSRTSFECSGAMAASS